MRKRSLVTARPTVTDSLRFVGAAIAAALGLMLIGVLLLAVVRVVGIGGVPTMPVPEDAAPLDGLAVFDPVVGEALALYVVVGDADVVVEFGPFFNLDQLVSGELDRFEVVVADLDQDAYGELLLVDGTAEEAVVLDLAADDSGVEVGPGLRFSLDVLDQFEMVAANLDDDHCDELLLFDRVRGEGLVVHVVAGESDVEVDFGPFFDLDRLGADRFDRFEMVAANLDDDQQDELLQFDPLRGSAIVTHVAVGDLDLFAQLGPPVEFGRYAVVDRYEISIFNPAPLRPQPSGFPDRRCN